MKTFARRIAWGATLRRWLAWGCLLSLSTFADAKPRKPTPAEVKREQERKRAERERAIQECMNDRDGDPDVDREICEDQVPR